MQQEEDEEEDKKVDEGFQLDPAFFKLCKPNFRPKSDKPKSPFAMPTTNSQISSTSSFQSTVSTPIQKTFNTSNNISFGNLTLNQNSSKIEDETNDDDNEKNYKSKTKLEKKKRNPFGSPFSFEPKPSSNHFDFSFESKFDSSSKSTIESNTTKQASQTEYKPNFQFSTSSLTADNSSSKKNTNSTFAKVNVNKDSNVFTSAFTTESSSSTFGSISTTSNIFSPSSNKPSAFATLETASKATIFGATGTNASPFGNTTNAFNTKKSSTSHTLPLPTTTDALTSSLPTSTVTPTASSANTLNYKEKLIAFYTKHNPSKLTSVDKTLETFKGKEDILFQKLHAKYASSPYPLPEGSGPKCFLDVRIGPDGTKETNTAGRIVIQLYADKTPLAAENFRALCTGEQKSRKTGRKLHYKNCTFHRIVPGFVIQGGDFTKHNGTGGESIYTGTSHGDLWGNFKDETPFLQHSKRGLLSMANNGPNRNGSQFFITLKPVSYLNGKHVIFGEVIDGLDIVDLIESIVETDKGSKPLPHCSVTITDCGEC